MEEAGIIISILALTFSVFTYFNHDKKLKKQSTLLNDYNLDKIKKERVEEKRAIIEANIIREAKGKRIIKIYNRGKSIANDVEVIVPEYISLMDNPSPIDILPQHSIDLITYSFVGSEDKFKICFKWKDNHSLENEATQTLFLS